jgi:Polyketide cyclase / dehydrase and lipid transport
MDVTAEMLAPCGREDLFAWVEDLVRYPDWLEIGPRAVPAEPQPGDPGPAWSVDLRGQLGPFARAKRLRMVRTVHQPPAVVQFERIEHDGRHHSAWVLRAEVTAAESGTRLTMHLHYGGGLGGPLVEKLLADEIDRSRPRLIERLTAA